MVKAVVCGTTIRGFNSHHSPFIRSLMALYIFQIAFLLINLKTIFNPIIITPLPKILEGERRIDYDNFGKKVKGDRYTFITLLQVAHLLSQDKH